MLARTIRFLCQLSLVAALVAVTACGGGSDEETSDKILGNGNNNKANQVSSISSLTESINKSAIAQSSSKSIIAQSSSKSAITQASSKSTITASSDRSANTLSSSKNAVTQTSSKASLASKLAWAHPNSRENGEYLELSEIGGYELRYQGPKGDYVHLSLETFVTQLVTNELPKTAEFEIAVYDTDGRYSRFVPIQPH